MAVLRDEWGYGIAEVTPARIQQITKLRDLCIELLAAAASPKVKPEVLERLDLGIEAFCLSAIIR